MFKSTVGALVFLLAAVSADRYGCDNQHPYCKKDNHPKEACTDWGEAWKGWMEENCPEKCGKCGGGGGGPPPGPPGRGRFGCDNPHPYCKKDNHPKEACT